VELCAAIPEGGTTPSYGEIRTAQALTSVIDINVIIRPRGGDFLYTPAEIQSMLYDIEMARQLDVHGVVFGCLTREGDVDVKLLHRLVAAAGPLSVTFHRAFDVCRDPFTALEQIIDAGCDRILTSGQQPDAVKGIPLIAELVKRAGDRIIIMPGCGVREDNIARIEAETGAREFHTSARSVLHSAMEYRNERAPMGSSVVTSEFETVQTDRKKVAAYL
jgi:copper homeostasis protein